MAPKNKVFLSSFVGNGIQLLFLLVIICVFGLFNLFESHSKGETKTAGIMVYAFAGIINGYFSAQYYKYMGGKHWALNVIVSSFLFPVRISATVNSFSPVSLLPCRQLTSLHCPAPPVRVSNSNQPMPSEFFAVTDNKCHSRSNISYISLNYFQWFMRCGLILAL